MYVCRPKLAFLLQLRIGLIESSRLLVRETSCIALKIFEFTLATQLINPLMASTSQNGTLSYQ